MMQNFSWPLRNKRVWVAGQRGMVGRAVAARLRDAGCLLVPEPEARIDLRRQVETEAFITDARPDAVIVAAALVGGIGDNAARPASFLYDNLMIAANVIESSHRAGIDRLLYLGSSCIYPRDAAQPIGEDALLSGPLEPTNEAYAIAKIAGLKLCETYRRQYGRAYIAAMPCNLYGPGDRYDAEKSHVIPALILKLDAAVRTGAPTVTLWGTGRPRREFLHVDDLARALLVLLEHYDEAGPINIGAGSDMAIADLAADIASIVGYNGEIRFDPQRPDGTMRKLMDSSRIRALGWQPEIPLRDGLADAYHYYLRHIRT